MATILIVEARFYPHLNDMLLAGARRAAEAAGTDVDRAVMEAARG